VGTAVQRRLNTRFKEIARDPDYADERQALDAYAALLDQQLDA